MDSVVGVSRLPNTKRPEQISILMNGIKSRHVVAVIASRLVCSRLLAATLFFRSFSKFRAISRSLAASSAEIFSFCGLERNFSENYDFFEK